MEKLFQLSRVYVRRQFLSDNLFRLLCSLIPIELQPLKRWPVWMKLASSSDLLNKLNVSARNESPGFFPSPINVKIISRSAVFGPLREHNSIFVRFVIIFFLLTLDVLIRIFFYVSFSLLCIWPAGLLNILSNKLAAFFNWRGKNENQFFSEHREKR